MMAAENTRHSVQLATLLKGIAGDAVGEVVNDITVTGMSIDSRQLNSGDVFIALAGAQHNGLDYLQDVIANGVVAVLYEKDNSEKYRHEIKLASNQCALIGVKGLSQQLGLIASRFFGEPSKQMQVIGVTGTDGKTSVSRFIAEALSEMSRCGVIGTTGYGVWGELNEATHTTPDALSVQQILSDLHGNAAKYVAMEVSSHGIHQGRINAVDFDTVVLTNITRDHLDYHGTETDYKNVKKSLFLREGLKHIVLNIDDQSGQQLFDQLRKSNDVWAYSLKKPDVIPDANYVYIKSMRAKTNGFYITVQTPAGEADVTLHLHGQFNVSNCLAVFCVLLSHGISLDQVVNSIEKIRPAPGRMELFESTGKPALIVDFAHTPAALESALSGLRQHSNGKLWCVFGCGGDRDKGKRSLMGGIAEKLADHVMITNDNPRSEDPETIINDILQGIERRENVQVILDRRQAIETAFNNASLDDVILVAGKGHESYQVIGNEKQKFSDRGLAAELTGGALE